MDGTESFFLTHADGRPPDELQQGHESDHRLEAILRFQDELDQLDRSVPQPVGDQVELFLQRPGPAMDDQRPRWYTRKDAVERGNEKVDVQRLFLSARLHRSRGRGKRKCFLLRALEQLARDLLIRAVFLETLPHLILPPEELRLVIGRYLAWQQANRLEQEKARGHPQKFRHLLRIRDLTRCDFNQVGVGHLREGDLEDIHLLPLDQSEEELQRTFEHGSVDIQLGAHRSARRLHDAQAYLRATS